MTHRVLVLGAGYAGLPAAKRLAVRLRGRDAGVTLVNATDRFVERIRMHQLAAGQTLRDLPLSEILAGTGVDLVTARVTAIRLDARTVELDAPPHQLHYDTLINALGSSADVDVAPGAREHAFTVAAAGDAARLSAHLARSPGPRTVAVVGGGLTGIEAATELAEAHPGLRIELVTAERLGRWLSDRAQRYLRRALDRRRIRVHEETHVDGVDANGLLVNGNRALAADAVVWAAGFRASPLARDAGMTVDRRGRMVVDATLRSLSHPEVYGAGDAAAAPAPGGDATRMSCQTGLPMGLFAADAVARRVIGKPPRHIRIRYVWQNISLGRHDGITQFTRSDDSPLNAVLAGRIAAGFKETISRGAALAARYPGPYAPWHMLRRTPPIAEQALYSLDRD